MTPPLTLAPQFSCTVFMHCLSTPSRKYWLVYYSSLSLHMFFFLAFCFLYFCTFIFVFNSKYICNMVSATAGSAIFIGFFNQLIKFLSIYVYIYISIREPDGDALFLRVA